VPTVELRPPVSHNEQAGQPASVSIATVTFARNVDEERRVLAALEELSRSGIRVVAADGGSPQTFVDRVANLPHLEIMPNADEPGLVGQARFALRLALSLNTDRILYTEPDKLLFFRTHLHTFIERARDSTAGIVLAARSAASFESYPASQRFAEGVLNTYCSTEVGRVADYSYGPFMMRRDLVGALDDLPAFIGWGWRPFLFVTARKYGHDVIGLEGDFECAEADRVDDETQRRHRLCQLAENLAGVVRATRSVEEMRNGLARGARPRHDAVWPQTGPVTSVNPRSAERSKRHR